MSTPAAAPALSDSMLSLLVFYAVVACADGTFVKHAASDARSLPALVSRGLLEHLPSADAYGERYRISDAGREILAQHADAVEKEHARHLARATMYAESLRNRAEDAAENVATLAARVSPYLPAAPEPRLCDSCGATMLPDASDPYVCDPCARAAREALTAPLAPLDPSGAGWRAMQECKALEALAEAPEAPAQWTEGPGSEAHIARVEATLRAAYLPTGQWERSNVLAFSHEDSARRACARLREAGANVEFRRAHGLVSASLLF